MYTQPTFSRFLLGVAGVTLIAGLFSCQTQNNPPAAVSPAPTAESGKVSLTGAGASFPAPLYQRWSSAYNETNPNVQISYQSVGSGAGVNQFLAGTVDFGATDAPLTDKERQQYQTQYNGEPVQIPMTGGAVVFAYNLGGDVKNLRLSRQAYCGIVTGELTNWNDPQIAQDNPGANLPNSPINFVHRSDGSGTTFIFTNHIAAACPNWKAGVGKSVSWPTGAGAKGNEGVTAQIQQTQGAIGYIEYSYAVNNNLNFATLENRSGQFVAPSPETAARVLEGQQIPADFALEVPDPTDQQAYPIVGLTWLLLYHSYADPQKAVALQNFVKWALNEGDKYAVELGYLPLTNEVAQRVVTTVDQQIAQR
uniref:Phosphate-binding protein n=1 Tax=Cyanothece sp. (strain PCC 7425 / ATCC 29141) TaxID=395961 RepID=B8HNN7_CYAP4